MFVTLSGQIGIVGMAPRDTTEPMTPRYLSGPTRIVSVAGIDVRVTELGVDDICDNAGELGGWYIAFGWIMETPINGTVDEMIDMVSSLAAENGCGG